MDVCLCILFLLLVPTQASIDSIFEEVEDDFYSKQVAAGKSDFPSWDEYEMPNRTEKFVKYQHDMIMEKDHFDQMMMGGTGRKKRIAVKYETRLWPHTVPYEIDDRFGTNDTVKILLAIQHVMQLTCVVFKPHENETNYVNFVPVDSECSSHVGVLGEEQQIKLAPKCLKKSVLVHEIGHALGLYHEHMRNNRDDFVRVHLLNVKEGKDDQFRKMKLSEYNDYDKPYDYTSLMHYGKHYFAKKFNATYKLVTLSTLDENYTDVIGQAVGLSFYDIKILNSMYKCTAGCKPKKCRAGEFLGKGCECFCAGTSENAAVPCSQKANCLLPTSEGTEEYCFWDLQESVGLNSTNEVPHGGLVEISYCNSGPCGRVISNVKCNDGIWEGNTVLPCIIERCEINPRWRRDYELYSDFADSDPSASNTVPHNEIVDLLCPNNPDILNTPVCSRGQWQGRIIPCTGQNCTVKYKPGDRFTYVSEDGDLSDGAIVQHATTVQTKCGNDENDIEATNVTCIDGKLDGKVPTGCPRTDSLCPLIADATVTSHATQFNMYHVKCLEGYDKLVRNTNTKLSNDEFTCDKSGIWRPSVPACSPANCTVPAVGNGFVHSRGHIYLVGAEVESGRDVILKCDYGHIPEEMSVACDRGKWDVGVFPTCTKVVCGVPPVIDTTYSPKRPENLYKDQVFVDRCKTNKIIKGQTTLTCLSNGTWSGRAECRDYCEDGTDRWEDIKTHRLQMDGFRVRARKFGLCKKRCKRQKSFLCLAISFGYEAKKRKWTCFLHRIDLDKEPEMLKHSSRWSVSKRVCL